MPRVCMFVAAYNESSYVDGKVANLLELDYPQDLIQYLWITDGSDDGTPEMLKKYPQMEVHHLPERRGKIHAMNRGIQFVNAPIVIFSDSNTTLCKQAIRVMVDAFNDPQVGCIAGEKRIVNLKADGAAGSGENMYWKFESWVKRMDSELNSVVGAVGELFAIRTSLYTEVENDTILDDFVISLRIAEQGYRIAYTPNAYAIETASANVKEELKRKIRIAAGGIQSVIRLYPLLNIFKYGLLSFQYISHRVLRWTITPIAMIFLLLINIPLALYSGFFAVILGLQVLFYVAALLGWVLENRKLKVKLLFIPYYFFIMNYAVFMGFGRYIKKTQSVNWERAKRG